MRSWDFLEHSCCNVYAVLWVEVCALLVVSEHKIFPVGSVCPAISSSLLQKGRVGTEAVELPVELP